MRLRDDDGDRIIDFFRHLYWFCDAGHLEVRCIDLSGGLPSKSDWFPACEGGSLCEARDYASSLNAAGYDVFFGVNPRVNRGQEDKDVLAGVALWADIDGLGSAEEAEEKLEECLKHPVRPDAAVYSGKGLHLYVILKEPVDPVSEAWPSYLRALKGYAEMAGGDPKCVNPSRILRFPLSYSHKRQKQTKLWLSDDLP